MCRGVTVVEQHHLQHLQGVVLGVGREEEGRPLLVFQPNGVGEESEEWRGS